MKKLVLIALFAILLAGCGGDDEVVVDDPVEPVNVLACAEGMGEYQVSGTPIQFCYDPAWGEPVIENIDTVQGTLAWVRFTDTLNDGVEIWYESAGFVGHEGDVTYFDFESLNLIVGEDRIKEQLMEQLLLAEDALTARKSDISGKRAVRVHFDYYNDFEGQVNEIRYYVPDAFEGYHMTVTASADKAVEIDEFVYDMVL